MSDLDTVKKLLFQFRDDRNWKQFHTLKDLIISLNLEAAELLELTQWKNDEMLSQQTGEPLFREQLSDECADVLLYLLLVADTGGIDLMAAAQRKIEKNAVRYPVDLAYGSAKKHPKPDTAPVEEPKPPHTPGTIG